MYSGGLKKADPYQGGNYQMPGLKLMSERTGKDVSFEEVIDPAGRKIVVPRFRGGRPEKPIKPEKGGPWQRHREKDQLRKEFREMFAKRVAQKFLSE